MQLKPRLISEGGWEFEDNIFLVNLSVVILSYQTLICEYFMYILNSLNVVRSYNVDILH